MTERSEVEYLDNLRFEASDLLRELSSKINDIMTGACKDSEDTDELYHQINDVVGIMDQLSQEASPLQALLEEGF